MAPPVEGSKAPATQLEPVVLPDAATKTVADPAAPPPPLPAAPVKLGPSGRPIVEHREGKTDVSVTPPDDRFVLRPGLGLGFSPLGGIGGKDAGLFSKDANAATGNGSWTFVDLSLTTDFRLARLFDHNASLFLGGRFAYQAHRGDRATGGSSMDLGQIALSLGLDWKNSMASWNVLLPSRLAIYGGGIYGAGETTAGEHFSVAATRGLGYALGAEADIFGVKINKAGDSIQVSWKAETGQIPHARGNAPYSYWYTGPALTVPLAFPGSIQRETRVDTDVELCRADQPTLEKLVGDLKLQQADVLVKYEEFKRLAALLAKKGYTPEKILNALRTGYVKKLEAMASSESTSKLEAAVAAALGAKRAEFDKIIADDKTLTDQPSKDKRLAELQAAEKARVEAEFAKAADPEMDAAIAKILEAKKPELEKIVAGDKSLTDDKAKAAKLELLMAAEKAKAEATYRAEKAAAKEAEFLAKAKVAYPDGYNHFELTLPDVMAFDAGFTIPTDCAGQEGLYDRLMEDRRKLDIFLTRIEERTHFMYFALGKPAKKVVDALGGLGFAQFPPLNFIASQPDYGIKNEGPGKRGPDMDKIETFYEANKGKRFTANDPALQKAFKGIFAGNELLALEDTVKQLNGEKPMRGVKTTKLSEAQLKEMIQKIPVLVEANVSITDGSTEGNQILSDNRGVAVIRAMVLLGMNPDRIRSVGMGESNPIVPETVDWSKTGKRVKNLSWAREKNRRVQFWVDTEKLEAAETKLEATVSAPPKAEPAPAPPPSGGVALPPEPKK